MKRMFLVLVGVMLMGVFANNALAANGSGGYIEVCKAPNAALTGTFSFNIHDTVGDSNVVIGLGTCTQPLPVAPGPVTVTELGSLTGLDETGDVSDEPTTSFVSATTTAVGPTGTLRPGIGFDYTTTVPASSVGSTAVVTVTYNDVLVTGVVEVCKSIVTGSGLTGLYSFTITGGNGFSQVITVPIGACSSPITVPAGLVKVQETGDLSEAVTSITATQTAAALDAVVGPNEGPSVDLPTGTVVASVEAGDASMQTLVTYTNNSVRLKLCKYVDRGLTNTTAPGNSLFPFTFSSSGNAGPNGPIAPLSLAAGNSWPTAVCTVVGTFRAGTTVTITEGIIAGTKVGSITTNPVTNVGGTSTVVPGSLKLQDRTVQVVLGAGETVVTYEDIPALPGSLKICKVAGVSVPPVAPGTLFAFTVTPVAPVGLPKTVSVPAGQCVVVGSYPFNTQVSIVETALPNTTVQSITAVPTMVSVIVNGVATDTNQQVLTSVNLAGRSANATVGENNITEVTVVNIDPPSTPAVTAPSTPAPSTTAPSTTDSSTPAASTSGASTPAASSNSGSSSSGSSSSGSSTPAAATATPTLSVTPSTTGGTLQVGNTTSTSTKAAVTKAALLKAVKLQKLQKQVTTLKVTLKTLVAKHAAAKTLAQKHSLANQIATVKLNQAKLILQIALLKK